MTITAGPASTPSAESTVSLTAPAPTETVEPVAGVRIVDSAATPGSAGQWVDLARLKALRPPRLAGGAAVIFGIALTGLGAAVDAVFASTPGPVFAVTFLLSCAVVAALVSRRSLATAVVLPPALFGAVTLVCLSAGGQDRGSRELLLDWATTLALWAPVIFVGTGITLAIVAGRWITGLVRRTA